MRNSYGYGPNDHRFYAEDVREDDEGRQHKPVKNPSAQEMALAGHEVLASADPTNWRYPERDTTYNQDKDGDMPSVIYPSDC